MKKNDVFEAEITGMTLQGAGIARCEGAPVFVPAACTGDFIRATVTKMKDGYGYGRLQSVLRPAPARVVPDCAVFPKCGGCAFQHIAYAAELALKERELRETLRRIGKIEIPLRPILGAQSAERYRNKAMLPLRRDGEAVEAGFFARHSHRIVPCVDCRLAPESFARLAKAVCEWVRETNCTLYDDENGRGLLRQLYLRQNRAGSQVLVTLVIHGEGIPRADRLICALRSADKAVCGVLLNHNSKPGNTLLGGRCTVLWGGDTITDSLCGLEFRLSPLSFFQVNPAQTERLYAIAADYALQALPAGKTLRLLDLYCGTGTIGLSVLAQLRGRAHCRLIGVDCADSAIADAKRNAENNGLGAYAHFICADAADAAVQLRAEGWQPDVILIDPPRKGCEPALLHTIEAMRPARIVYISCDPATLARDLAMLQALGYAAREAVPVDMFPRTGHLESVTWLERCF
ncbi:MAG: 23S rRNA (uracil(1939)-C(5))-methyltransferase RlmD [Oscillospiraceae bacterium]|nr:23S rRNA (uracil(1939)-C(5))-methyltransferase RlmD [Oscillospiraceae bacterium]